MSSPRATEYYSYEDIVQLLPRRSAAQDNAENGRAGSCCVKRRLCCGQSGPRMWCLRRVSDRCGVALVAVALFLMVMGGTAPALVNKLIAKGIDEQTVVVNDPSSEAYKTFVDSGYERGIYLNYSIWWFNITNPDEVLRGETPEVQEIGPFVYRERRQKLYVEFSHDDEQVTYRMLKYYVFDAEATPNGLSDELEVVTVDPVIQFLMVQLRTMLEMPMNALISGSQEQSGWLSRLERLALRAMRTAAERAQIWEVVLKLVLCEGNEMGVSPFRKMAVRDLYWGHDHDSVLVTMHRLTSVLSKLTGGRVPIPPVPKSFPGIQHNITDETDLLRRVGPNTIHTGKRTRDALQQYVSFENMTFVHACPDPSSGPEPVEGEMPACYLYQAQWSEEEASAHGYIPQWGSFEANRVTGTDGSMFQHPLHDVDEIVTFQEDYRRSVTMRLATEHRSSHGIPLRRYVFRDDDWQNNSVTSASYFQEHLPTGLANLSRTAGFPMFLSKPHFLEADPDVQASVLGLTPDMDMHMTYVDAEPISGVTFETHKRVQLNVLMEPLLFPTLSPEVSTAILLLLGRRSTDPTAQCFRSEVAWNLSSERLFLPMMWYDEGMVMPQSFAKDFHGQVYGSMEGARVFRYAGLGVGAFLLLCAIVLFVVPVVRERRDRKTKTPPKPALLLQEETKEVV